MKEQIFNGFSNRTMKQLSNESLGLTTHRFPPTLRMEGNIFMPEPGNGEGIPGGNAPKPTEAAKPRETRELWEKHYLKGRDLSSLPHDERQTIEVAIKAGLSPVADEKPEPHTPSEKAKIRATGEELMKLTETPELERQTKKLAEKTPEQERVKEYREKMPLMHGQILPEEGEEFFPNVDDFNSRLRPIADYVNRRVQAGRADIDFIEEQIRLLEGIMIEPGVMEDNILSTQIREMQGQLYSRYLDLEQQRDRQLIRRQLLEAEREKYGIFGERRLTPGEKELIKSVVRDQQQLTEQQINLMVSEGEEIADIARGIFADRQRHADYLFNRMFEIVDANPKSQFQENFSAGTYEYLEFTRTINEAITETRDPIVRQQIYRYLRRYVEERKLREAAHNANFVVAADGELDQLVGFVGGVQSEEVDLAFSKTGVSTAMHFYEQALLKIREENDGYIPTYVVVGEAKEGSRGRADDLTRDYISEAIRIGALPQMQDWEIDRAISLARGMGIIDGRFLEIAATSKLPGDPEPGASFAPRIVSVYAGKIVSNMSPFKHIAYKYDVYGDRNKVFAYLLNRGKKPWTKEELENLTVASMLNVVNGLVEDKDARYMSVLNPFKLGGIFSRTTWRFQEDPVVGATGDFVRRGITEFKSENNISDDVDLRTRREGVNYERYLSASERRIRSRASSLEVEAINALLETGSDFTEDDPRIIDMIKYKNWIGTGSQIELLRGGLLTRQKRRELEDKIKYSRGAAREETRRELESAINSNPEAERDIREVLEKIARTQPLKLFYNLKGPKLSRQRDNPIPEDLQKHVLRRLGKRITGDRLLDEELRGDLDTLAVLQEKALRDSLNTPDKHEVSLLDVIDAYAVGGPTGLTGEQSQEEPEEDVNLPPAPIQGEETLPPAPVGVEERQARAARLRRFVEIVNEEFTQPRDRFGRDRLGNPRSHLDKFVEDLRDREWKLPFSLGTDDVPFEEYRFAKTSSDSFQRRWKDMGQGKLATETMIKIVKNMPNFRSPDQIVPLLHELYDHISFYDEGIAREVVMNFAEGITKFYKKDWYAKLPFFMGTVANIAQTLTGRGSSFSELAFGKEQMSWDEIDVGTFTSQLRGTGAFKLEQMNSLREKVGGHKREVAYAYVRLMAPILLLALAYYMTSRSVRGRE